MNHQVIANFLQPLKDAVDGSTAGEQQKPPESDHRHRHTIGWPEVMIEEGVAIRA
ncbi:MAG: hypothetical protein NUV60_01770 [Patescibacteria group bacterium]|nr:hypothetical protein [Patescibacteria group bacterium]